MKTKLLLICLLALVGCSTASKKSTETVKNVYVVEPASVPVATEQYCWEEPVVEYQQDGPGLDSAGEWYYPAYNAVRRVKGGTWVPCSQLGSR